MSFIIRWIITGAALFVAAWIVPGIHVNDESGWVTFAIVAAVLSLINTFVRPVLALVSCGCIILTLGVFLLFINGFTLWLTGWIAENWLDVGFSIDTYWSAFFGAIIISLVSFVLTLILEDV